MLYMHMHMHMCMYGESMGERDGRRWLRWRASSKTERTSACEMAAEMAASWWA
jgi:hypothetical protein